MQKILECVPNFSEGINTTIIDKIVNSIKKSSKVRVLNVDPGKDTNRTVVTFIGSPEDVLLSAYESIKVASDLIEMSAHKGEHPRMGATDVCPLIPIKGITEEEAIEYSKELAFKVSKNLDIPVFLYEKSASNKSRINLADIREGEYEGMFEKIKDPKWRPDFGPAKNHKKAGVTAIGVRNFLIAYNINLNTSEQRIATDIALSVREQGRNKRDRNGKFIRDENGIPIKSPGLLKNVKAVGWYLEEYGIAQISMNLTDYSVTSIHKAFEEVRIEARKRGVRVTGSEIVGLVPLDSILSAGLYYLDQQKSPAGIPEGDIIKIAISSLGLNEINEFNPIEKILEYQIVKTNSNLATKTLTEFAECVSRKTPTPGGGSVGALAGSMAASLVSMVANLTTGKKKWNHLFSQMSATGLEAQDICTNFIDLIDADSNAYNDVINAYRESRNFDQVKAKECIDKALIDAIETPKKIMEQSSILIDKIGFLLDNGNNNTYSDMGVALEMIYASFYAGKYNVQINLSDLNNSSIIDSYNEYIASSELIFIEKYNNLKKIIGENFSEK